jgi:hypothetical protein
MEFVGQSCKPSAVSVVPIRFPWFVRIALLVLTSVAIIIFGDSMATRREMSNPFSAFSDLFGSDARQAALARGFTCRDDGSSSSPQRLSDMCTQRGTEKIFAEIYLWASGSAANEIRFSPRENTLALGDLAALWGTPEIRQYCETLVYSWPAHHVTALLAEPRTGRINYFSPVLSVSFTYSGLPQWGRVLVNDALHNC